MLRRRIERTGVAVDELFDDVARLPGDPVVDPTGPETGSHRVLRGGSWSSRARYCRSAFRRRIASGYRYASIGFRLVRTSD